MLRKHFSIENWRIHRQTTMTISSFHWLESCILIRNSHEDGAQCLTAAARRNGLGVVGHDDDTPHMMVTQPLAT